MNINFTNKVVLVTGASVGIGEHTAILFAKYGAKLAIVGRNEANLRAVAAKCEQQKGLKPLVILAEFSTDEGVEKAAKQTLDHYGKLDVLVNNAAIGRLGTVQEMDMDIFDELFKINIKSPYYLTKLLLPALIESKGNIINVSSVGGTMAIGGTSAYAMTKAAINHFTRVLAIEMAPKGVRVNTVSPGVTVSDFVKRMLGYTEEQYQEWLKKRERTIPMGKACEGDDIANMIVHLASDASRLVSGTLVEVDGAMRFGGSVDLLASHGK